MYSLRSINNMYSEHAGSRSDFIIVGHPEFTDGKVRCSERGLPNSWDTRPKPHMVPARARSTGALLLRRLTEVQPSATYKERALERKRGEQVAAASAAMSAQRLPPTRDFNVFLDELSRSEPEREFRADVADTRTPASHAGTVGYAAVCRHFSRIDGELGDLRTQFRRDPEGTRKKLRESGAWRYYAEHAEQAKRLETQFSRERAKKGPAVARAHSPQSSPRSPSGSH